MNVSVGEKNVVTPRRSLCLTSDPLSEAKMLRGNPRTTAITAINELPREIDKHTLDEIDNDKDKQEAFCQGIRYRFSGVDTSTEITTFVFSYSNRGRDEKNKEPTKAEVEYLCGILDHPYNDIWIPPIIPGLSGRSYIPYLEEFYRQAKSHRGIACAGLIPHIGRLDIRLLADLYQNEGINYFVMDFDGKHPLDLYLNINEVVKMIETIERENSYSCFLHGVNVPITKARWKNPIVPAKDILLFEMGFNCFGSSHIRRQLPPEVAEKMKSTAKRPFRVFNRRDYGYYRNDTPGLRNMITEDEPTTVSLNDFTNGLTWNRISQLEKLFNVERHALESNEIRRRLIEKKSVGEYIKIKKQIPQTYLRKVFKLAKGSSANSTP
jgi:hypothetical protein